MVYYSALHWAKKAEKSAEKCEQIQEDLRDSGLDLSDYAKKGEVVHNTGDETIDGVKTFNDTVLSYNPLNAFNSLNENITRGTAPTSGQNGFLTRISDKYNTNLAGLYYTHTVENKNSLSMLVYDPTKSSGYDQAFLRLGYGGSGSYVETVKPANTGSQSSANIATVGWANDPSASLNIVHRTGDETIEGGKRFKSSLGALYVRFTGSDSMTAPSSERYNTAIRCEDKNGKNTGNFRNVFSTNGNITTDMQVCRQINGTSKFADMGVRMSNTGVVSTFAPTPPAGDNSTQIATTEWVSDPTKSTNVLHRTGDESFSGNKTMLGSRFIFGATNLGSYKEIEARSEKGNTRLGVLRFTNGSDGITRSIEISAVDNTNSYRGGLKIGINSSGKTYITAPTPPAGDNSAQIATTEWVRTLINNSSDVVESGENWVKFKKGLILQWGGVGASSGYSTILFNTPFEKTNYALSLLNVGPSNTGYVSYKVHTRETTQAEIAASTAGSVVWIAIGF